MTEFEKELKPIEDWIEEKLKGRLPYSRDLDVFFCAALIKQYQAEKLNIPVVINSDSDVCPNAKKCKIIMFTSDLDICQKCNKTFDGK